MNLSETNSFQSVTYLKITVDQAGQRIDNFLLNYFKNVPKSHIYRILRKGEVRINKGRIKPTYRLKANDLLRLPPIQYQPKILADSDPILEKKLAQNIIYEDKYLLIINKPPGIAVHGGNHINIGVIEGLRSLLTNMPYLELAHRLDRDTSGCLMIAKKRSMLRRLHDLLRQGKIHKQYLALVKGRWQANITHIDAPLKKNILQSGERMVLVDNNNGKSAISKFHVEQSFPTATLLRVYPQTGRTHQIRVHATYGGHPIAGDQKYGDKEFNQYMHNYGLKRLFLHATKLEFSIPDINYHLAIQAPLPTTLQQILNKLRLKKT